MWLNLMQGNAAMHDIINFMQGYTNSRDIRSYIYRNQSFAPVLVYSLASVYNYNYTASKLSCISF